MRVKKYPEFRRLKMARIENEISQRAMAERLNIRQKVYSDWENGYTSPTLFNLVKIARVLNTTVADLTDKK
jgi:transcriptional regulator with XRE-family HTH domain